jgi:hypothetical protein
MTKFPSWVVTSAVALLLVVATPALGQIQCGNGYQLKLDPRSIATGGQLQTDVILIHGFVPQDAVVGCSNTLGRHPEDDYFSTGLKQRWRWAAILHYLNLRGVRVYEYRWPTGQSIADAGDLLKTRIDQQATALASKIVLVNHSMGGLVALQSVVSGSLRGRVVRVITLATPHRGTAAGAWGPFFLYNAALVEVQKGSLFLGSLRNLRLKQDAAMTYVYGGHFSSSDPLDNCVTRKFFTGGFAVSGDCLVSLESAYDNCNADDNIGKRFNWVFPPGGLDGTTPCQVESGRFFEGYDHYQMGLYGKTPPGGGQRLFLAVKENLLPGISMADLNADGRVDVLDLGRVLAEWNRTAAPAEEPLTDINQDGVVNVQDLGTILSRWAP